jgi:hypothetical protein
VSTSSLRIDRTKPTATAASPSGPPIATAGSTRQCPLRGRVRRGIRHCCLLDAHICRS